MIPSRATKDGTASFVSRSKAAEGHFRSFAGLSLSSLGIGTYLGRADAETDRLVEAAVKQSITSGAVNVIDTAINYRFQRAERSVGRALRSLVDEGRLKREEVFVCTKNGYLAPDSEHARGQENYLRDELISKGIIGGEDIVDGSHCMSVPYFSHELERSQTNLQLETIDLMYLHNAAEAQIPDVGKPEFLKRLLAAMAFFEEARKERKISFYGMATWDCFRNDPSADDHLELEDVLDLARQAGGSGHGFRFIQFPYNLAMPEAFFSRNQRANGEEVTLLEACKKLGVGAFTSVPLLQGRLLRQQNLPRVDTLSPSQTNLQFARSSPGVMAPLAGHKEPKHVEENLGIAAKSPMSFEEFQRTFLGRA